MKPSHRNIVLQGKKDNFPQSLRGNLEVYYDNPQHPTIIQDKSGYNNNGTITGTVTDTPHQGRNVKTFNAAGKITLPAGKNVDYLYPFSFDGEIFDINMHQGITSDGTNWYASTDMYIKKWDANFNVLATHSIVDHTGGTHVGDLKYYNGLLYVVTEDFTSCPSSFSNQKISTFNAADLEYVESHDISAQGKEVSGITVNADDGLIYIVSFCSATTIQKYNLSTFEYIGDITTSSLNAKQGIDYYNGSIYISAGNGIYRLDKDGVTQEILCQFPPTCAENEGIHIHDADTIYSNFVTSNPTTNKLYRFKRNNDSWTMIIWIKTPYLPSELPSNIMRIIESENDYFDLYYSKFETHGVYVKITNANSSGTSATRTRILESSGKLLKDIYMMFAVTYDGNLVKLFSNNAQQGDVTSFTIDKGINVFWDLNIGGRSIEQDFQFIGNVGEFAILDKDLSTDEITEYYNRTRGKYGV